MARARPAMPPPQMAMWGLWGEVTEGPLGAELPGWGVVMVGGTAGLRVSVAIASYWMRRRLERVMERKKYRSQSCWASRQSWWCE